jgi:DDE superfamily endonuclease
MSKERDAECLLSGWGQPLCELVRRLFQRIGRAFDRLTGGIIGRYVSQHLVPTLRHGDIVIMDNPGSHKSLAVRMAIRTAGARLWYLPPYSPDFNPIEQSFLEIKHWMRMARKRTIEET